jgi:hypothetical protein
VQWLTYQFENSQGSWPQGSTVAFRRADEVIDRTPSGFMKVALESWVMGWRRQYLVARICPAITGRSQQCLQDGIQPLLDRRVAKPAARTVHPREDSVG